MTVVKPTHDEIIRELTKELAVVGERLDTARENITELKQAVAAIPGVVTGQNAVREEIKELKRELEEARKRRWALLPPVLGAIVNVLLAALVAYLISRR